MGGVKPFISYNNNLTELARQNRKNPTSAETRMWNEVLRMRQLSQFKFLRQKPIASFIVDFYCAELGLVIEIDGHDHAEKAQYDLERTRVLKELGLTVIRYGNNEVLENIEGVYEDLLALVQKINPLTPPSLPLSGEGQTGEGRTPSPLTRGDRGGLESDDDFAKADQTP